MSMTTLYRIDKYNRIVGLGGSWNVFALENKAPNVLAKNVIETSLFDHIHDDATQTFIQTILMQVRCIKKVFNYNYRCDAPTMKRFMQMEVSSDAYQNVTFVHRQIRVEKKSNEVVFFPAGKYMRHAVRCSMCNAIKINNQWIDPFDQLNNKSYFVMYSICRKCRLKRF